jgi:hypothetical protein
MEMINNQKEMQRTSKLYGRFLIEFFYFGIQVASQHRNLVSRRQIYEKLILPFLKLYPTYPGSATIKLAYQLLFDSREDVLLQELGSALAVSQRSPDNFFSKYMSMESMLEFAAEKAALIRNDRISAFEYVSKAFKTPGYHHGLCFHILLCCVKGQPPSDMAALLDSIIGTAHPLKLKMLVEGTRLEGFRDLHIYYVKKQIDAGQATKGTFLYLQLLLGHYRESLDFIAQQLDPVADKAIIREHFLLLVICSSDEALYRESDDLLGLFSDVLDAYFSGGYLENPTDAHQYIIERYAYIAFAAGIETADRLLAVFQKAPRVCYLVRTRYLLDNQRYAEAAEQSLDGIDALNAECCLRRTEAQLMLGLYDKAYATLTALLEIGVLTFDILRQLLVVAEKGEPALRKEARQKYDSYRLAVDKSIDYSDVVRTGIVFNDFDKKDKNRIRLLNAVNFQKQLDADAALPANNELLGACSEAAKIYEEKDMPLAAYECYRMMLAHNFKPEECRPGLARVLESIGNSTLPKTILAV